MEYKYDSQGNNILVKLAGKPVGTSIFNVAGNRTSFEEPNAGITTYVYDAYGQLRKQTDSNGNPTIYSYDVLGRTTTREGKEGVTEYFYKTTQGGLNKLEDVKGFNGIDQNYTYDNFGRMLSVTDNGFTHGYGYDPCGNTEKEVYPTGFELYRVYDANSFLLTVQDKAKGQIFFTGHSMDNLGNYSSYTLGNNITSDITYDAYGFPVTFSAGGAQNLRFDFDLQTGNLMGRYDSRSGLDETFTYDDLDRLRTSSKNNLSINYSRNGNIEKKTDAGAQNYIYDKTRINAVVKIPAAKDYSRPIQRVIYTPFHQPDEISEHREESDGHEYLVFTYGADYERRVMELRGSSLPIVGGGVAQEVYERRYYNGNYEEDQIAPTWWQAGIVRKIHYIAGGDGICAMYIQTQIGEGEIKDSVFYVYKDYLGSFLTFTDEKGDVKYEQNFDAWGRYRNIKDWSYVNAYNTKPAELPRWLYRGFTGHEHLNRSPNEDFDSYGREFNLINMNGRLYDPINGRMLSVDNYANDAQGTQGYNRYTYANNNPLRYTDPDGEWVLQAIGVVAGAAINISNHWGEISQGGKINWGKFAYAGVVGGGAGLAVSLGIGAIAGTAAVATSTAASIASGIGTGVVGGALTYSVQEGLNSLVFKSQFSSRGLIAAAVTGGIFGGITGIPAVGKALNQFSDKLDDAVETWWRGVPNGGSNITITAENVTSTGRPITYSAGAPGFEGEQGVMLPGEYNFDPDDVSLITPNGVVLPEGAVIPNHFIENSKRIGSYGIMENGRFVEKIRIDQATPINMKGPNVSHFHIDNGAEHIFDPKTWPWWKK